MESERKLVVGLIKECVSGQKETRVRSVCAEGFNATSGMFAKREAGERSGSPGERGETMRAGMPP
jgi:hypothetical protein